MYAHDAFKRFKKETGYDLEFETFEKAYDLERLDTEQYLRRWGHKRLTRNRIDEAALERLITYAKDKNYTLTTADVKTLVSTRIPFLIINMAVAEIDKIV